MRTITVDNYFITQDDDLNVVIRLFGTVVSRFQEDKELCDHELKEKLRNYRILASMYDEERQHSGLLDD